MGKATKAPKTRMNPIAKKMQKEQVITNNTVRQDFSYTHGACSLSFSLRTDNSSELRPFAEILKKALADVQEKIAGMKN